MPPRHGKSLLASHCFPAWTLARFPDWPLIHTSYTADLSNDFSRKIRELLGSQEFAARFPEVQLDPMSRAAERWQIKGRRGFFVSAGIGGPITGRGARVALIDDPLKNAEEADSEVVRARHRDWYTSTLYTRLERGGGIVLIMTRWHPEDLGGFVTTGAGTDEPPADNWEILRFPAYAELDDPLGRKEGEPLWPEGSFNTEILERYRRQLPLRHWEALYQQNPVPAQGHMLEVDKIRPLPETLPPSTRLYQAWDLAISTKQTADYTVGATIGVDAETNVYLLDCDRARYSFAETQRRFALNAKKWKPVRIGIETTGYQSAAFQAARDKMLLPFVEMKPHKDKAVRAQLLADRISIGKVFGDTSAPWWRNFQLEALAFPAGAHDDMVDAFVTALTLASRGRQWRAY
jgi:predicted phage terminase large subunit-like protein